MKGRLSKIKHFISAGPARFDGCDSIEEIMASGDSSEPRYRSDGSAESEIIYTSGTTGRPKGAVLVHHNQMALTTTVCSLYALNPEDRILHVAPLFHSANSTCTSTPAPTWGVTARHHERLCPEPVLATIQKEKITQFFGAPIMYLMMITSRTSTSTRSCHQGAVFSVTVQRDGGRVGQRGDQ